MPVRMPDFLFLVKVDEDIRLKRIRRRVFNNAYDFKTKTRRNMVGRMEAELEKFKPIIIDNSRVLLVDVVAKIYQVVSCENHTCGAIGEI